MGEIVKLQRRRRPRRRKEVVVEIADARPMPETISRVERLLRLATASGANENESRTAAVQAARLIVRNRLRLVPFEEAPETPPPPPKPLDYDETVRMLEENEGRLKAEARAMMWWWMVQRVIQGAPTEARATSWWRTVVEPVLERGPF